MSLEQTVDNLEIRYANAVTFVGTSNTMIDTTTGRIQTKGIQHNSNVITDVSGPHGRVAPTLKKYPEIVFDASKLDGNDSTNTYTQAGYTVSASTTYSTHRAFKAFNGVPNDFFHWQVGSFSNSDGTYSGGTQSFEGTPGEWLKIEVPNKIKPTSINLYRRDFDGQSPKDFKIYASITGSSWTLLTEQTGIDNWTNAAKLYNFDTGIYYKYFAILVTKITRTNTAGAQTSGTLDEIELYGYEEYTPAGDHSVDTTFMSRFNNPQLTGVQVLVDGATGQGTNQISGGPDPSGNQSTYVTDGKYWTLNGTLTSNLSVEANTFLEGDQPHAVSVWFNSSNLEANVSNTCVFSVSDQEHLNSENLDLQSNTWHNLTYAYQGEGGSRVTYLDGRKVAEDQAEDTFGEYPPFAMTGYSQGGYVVSASSLRSGHAGWHAFDKTKYAGGVGKKWASEASQGDTFTGGDSLYNGTNRLSSSTQPGAWLKIELPYKLRLQYMSLFSEPTTEQPEDFIIYGSNDDNTWDQLFQKTGATANTDYVNYMINSVSCYKYFALVVRRLISSTTIAAIDEWKLYGHRENDLVRLPDPTNVLKYPHIAMTGPAQRGYVASASRTHNTILTNNGGPWQAFDGTITQVTTEGWVSPTGYSNDTAGSTAVNGQAASFNGRDGDWLNIKLPHKITLSSFETFVRIDRDHEHPTSGYLYASNDGFATFQEIYSFTDVAVPGEVNGKVTHVIPSSHLSVNLIPYNEYRIQVTKVEGQATFAVISEMELFGTEEAIPVPIQIGGGNIDKVANFRVYDKFVGEDQALEIWDAQKDEFGRAKSSMTLQKGRLGIGTTEPQGRLAVLDEPHNLEEFPPRAMTDYKTYFEGHGEFCASSGTIAASNGEAYLAFNKTLFERGWHAGSETDAYYTNSIYQGTFEHGGYLGDWIRLDLPYKVKLSGSILYSRDDTRYIPRMPKKGVILGSNDNGVSWELVHSWDNETYEFFKEKRFVINSDSYFESFILVTQELMSTDTNNMVNLGEWRLFGTREQGQSVLHDGQLTLTKSLNVPRIGPALDADDTPRRDRLVVEYNTSTNPTFEGAVRDTSGRGLDGIMYTATYNASEKAIESNGNTGTSNNGPGGSASGNLNDYGSFETVLPSLQGNPVFTVSGWFKQNTIADLQLAWLFARNLRVTAQPGLSNKMHWLGITSGGRPRLALGGGGNLNLYYTDGSIKAGTWYHMVVVIEPTGTDVTQNHVRFYLDGVLQTTSNSGSSGTIDLGDGAPPRMHWLWQESSTVYYDGSVSNIKLHDTALTVEEVKTLYDMGRNGSVANPQPLHIAAPLYSPGTIVQVEQSIKTDTFSTTGASNHPVSPGNDVPGLAVTIHPKFANSKILVSYTVSTGAYGRAYLRIQRKQGGSTTTIAPSVGPEANTQNQGKCTTSHSGSGDSSVDSQSFEYYDTIGGTEPITYQIQAWTYHSVYYIYVNRGHDDGNGSNNGTYWARTLSSITAKEVCQ